VEHVDGQREDDGRVLLGADRGESLQVAELQGVGRLAHDVGGLFQLARGVHFTLGGDHLSKRSWIRLRSQAEFQKWNEVGCLRPLQCLLSFFRVCFNFFPASLLHFFFFVLAKSAKWRWCERGGMPRYRMEMFPKSEAVYYVITRGIYKNRDF